MRDEHRGMVWQALRKGQRKLRAVAGTLRARGGVRTYRVRDCAIRLEVRSAIEQYRARSYSTKEPETLDWIDRYVQVGDVLYDIGANIGLYALYAAKRYGGRCTVYAFEPEALNFAQLNTNVHLNGLLGVVWPCAVAVAGRTALDRMYLNPNDFKQFNSVSKLIAGAAEHAFGTPVDWAGTTFRPHHAHYVMGIALDALWGAYGLAFPTHLKIDVDGLEEQILDGAVRTLQDPRLRSVLIEVSLRNGQADRIVRRLGETGFVRDARFTGLSSESVPGSRYEHFRNYVFRRIGDHRTEG